MKRLIISILSCFVICANIFAQTASCMTVVNTLKENEDNWNNQASIDYILTNKNAFDFNNENDSFLYNLALGTCYYPLEMYAEALPCLREVTGFIDRNEVAIDLVSNTQFLITYYWEALCEFYTHAESNVVLEKMERAKTMLEKYNQINTDAYKNILSDIETLNSNYLNILSLVPTAMQYTLANNDKEAILIFEKIVQQFPSSRPVEEKAKYIQALCSSYIAVGNLNNAEALYLNTLTDLDSLGEQDLAVYRNLCYGLGVLYYELHNYQKSIEYLDRSKYLYEKNMDFGEGYILCLSNYALTAQELNNPYLAKLLIDVAVKFIRQYTATETTNKIVEGLHSVVKFTGKDIDEVVLSNQSDRTFKIRPYIMLLNIAASVNLSINFWDDAVLCMKESIAMCEKFGEPSAFIYNNLATLHLAQNHIEESLPYFEKAASLCKTDYEKNEVYFNYALALWLMHSRKCPEVATKTSDGLTQSIMESFAFLSQEERSNYYKHFEYYLPFLNLILYETGGQESYGEIYDNIIMTKGLLLRSSNRVKDAIMNSNDNSLKSNYNRLVQLRQQLCNEHDDSKRGTIGKEIENLDKELTRSAAEYGTFTKSNNIRWKNIRDNLNQNDIAIEFYNIPIITHRDTIQNMDGEPRYCAVILKKDYSAPHIVPLCKESQFKDLELEDFYDTDTIYKMVWQPLKEELKGVNNIYFAADREFHKIGIEYALLPDGQRMDDKYNIYRLSSTRVLAEEKTQENDGEAVLFGGLRYDLGKEQLIAESRGGDYHSERATRSVDLSNLRYGVEYLPGTKEEVEAISQDFKHTKARKCETIIGEAGTEEAFRSLATKPVSIIHLATHGFYWTEEEVEKRSYVSFLANSQNPTQNYEDAALLRSGLFFSGANIGLSGEALPDDVEDGVLTAQELSAMNLGKVDMVVMSACQSGLGETSGEGVFGLQRGFKLAGANTLLMSLWKVDDTATKELMTEFYRHYLSGKSKRESLRQAQQTVRKTHPDPEYWAAFILLDGIN